MTRPSWRRRTRRCWRSPTRAAKRLNGSRSCGRFTAARWPIRRPPIGSARRCSRSIRPTPPTARRWSASRRRAGTTGELCDRLRAVSAASSEQLLRRDLLVLVAELEEKRLGRAPEAEKVYVQILNAEPLHAGAFRALSRLYRDGQRWSELRALLDARQLAELDARERLDLLAQIADLDESALNDAGSRACGLREDAGAGSGGSARAPGARSPLRGARTLAGSRDPARDAGRLRLGERGAGAGVPPRGAARQPSGGRGGRPGAAGGDRRRRRPATKGRGGCSSAC